MSRNRNIVGMVLILAFFAGILVSRMFLWKGTLLVESPVAFSLTIKTERQIRGTRFECPTTVCSYKLIPGEYRITVEAEGFVSHTQSIDINWRTVLPINAALQKIPILTPLSAQPEAWKEDMSTLYFFFDEDGNFFRGQDSANVLLAEFSPEEARNFQIFSDTPETAFLVDSQKIYMVDAVGKRKFEIYSANGNEILRGIRIFTNDILIVQAETDGNTKIFLFDTRDRSIAPFPDIADRHLVCQSARTPDTVFYTVKEEGSWVFKKFLISEKKSADIAAYPFENEPLEIQCAAENAIFIHTPDGFFQLDF